MSTREDIIVHLESLLGSITGITAVYRDRADLPVEKLPAVVLLDGGEQLVQKIAPQNRAKMPPAIFVLRPQIFVILKPRDDMTNETLDGVAAPIGPELSLYRDQALAVIVNDTTLLELLTPNGQIAYLGCETDMQSGSSMIGQLQMHFEFYYVFVPPTD